MTATETTYDLIPDLARLLCAAERMAVTTGAVEKARRHLYAGLGLPELARAEEAETAIRKALEAASATARGDVITIAPERGPQRRMLVSHVEYHIITLTDLEGETP